MERKIKKDDNFLELIPVKKESQKWEINEDALVQLIIPRDGILDKIVRVFFKTPKVMRIDLDMLGSCVWKAIDGKRNVKDIAELLKSEFGKEAEPLYERLGTYINILRNNKFITLEKARD
ncbi:PqqD family protein [Crassaminicella thermophila]|uniref:PqqD family protein n=1 Tax=Crassaminicella thermophila TaxID=2599308 RepID=A0A5C0SF56_CRATE|nr:PqqD family protein [Crassaminicella thermophila]QEK11868.1 PqqD family protein [Crassaminicella thermophila]